MTDFAANGWIDHGTYWMSPHVQGTVAWLAARKKLLTASNFGTAIGQSIFSSASELALEMEGMRVKNFNDSALIAMEHGTATEPLARNWYSKTRNVVVDEVGLAVPKWDNRIGASLDGNVGTDGAIEIKSPFHMYETIDEYMKAINGGWKPPPFYHQHIWDSHYAQMQGGMKITDKKWCDYIVYATTSDRVFVERVPFNETYWNEVLYPGINRFFDEILPEVRKLK